LAPTPQPFAHSGRSETQIVNTSMLQYENRQSRSELLTAGMSKNLRPFSDASVVERSFKTRICANQQQQVGFFNADDACIQQIVRPQVCAVATHETHVHISFLVLSYGEPVQPVHTGAGPEPGLIGIKSLGVNVSTHLHCAILAIQRGS